MQKTNLLKKTLFSFLPLIILSFLLLGCAQTRYLERDPGADYSTYSTLADILRKQGNLQIHENGNDVRVLVRGINTIQLDAEPLYVVNGTPMGHQYSRINAALNVNDIASVRVLKSLAETNQYGEPGRNGVILIGTKVARNK